MLASASDPSVAYVSFDGHRSNDFTVYLLKTTDFGETWKPITKGLPQEAGAVHVIREHPKNPNLLFVGTEFGLYVSFDAGANWQELKNNLPRVPVDDIQIHPRDNDLILATHGRSVWILDDISPLEQMTAKVAASPRGCVQRSSGDPVASWPARATSMGTTPSSARIRRRAPSSISGPKPNPIPSS